MANEAEIVTVELIGNLDEFGRTVKQGASNFGSSMDQIGASAAKAEAALKKVVAAQQAGAPITAKMIKDAGGLAQVEKALAASFEQTARSARTSTAAITANDNATKLAGVSSRQMAQQSRQLGFQIADVSQQVALGVNPFVIFAQQGAQVASALEGSKGALGRFASFLGGPWGAVTLGATIILGSFLSKMLETGESLDDLVDKLKKQAKETENADRAQELFGETIEGVTDALRDNREALDKLAGAEETSAENARKVADAQREKAIAIREATLALLAQAQAEFASSREINFGAAGGAGAGIAQSIFAERVSGLEALVEKAEAAVIEARKQAAEANSFIIVEQATASAAEKINRKFDLQIETARKAALASGTVEAALRKEILAIEAAREAELKRLRDTERERNRKTTGLPKVTGKEIAAALGAPITSGTRTAAQNKAAGGVANSLHLSGQAIDIPLTVNGKPLTKDGIRSVLEPLGVQIKELLGPGDAGHDDHFHIAFDKTRADPAKIAANAQKEFEQESRRRQAFENELANLQGDEVEARQALITSAEEIARLEIEAIEISRQRFNNNLDALVEQKKLTDEESQQLREINDERALLRTELVKRREDERKFRMAEADLQRQAQFAAEQRADQTDLLQSQLDIARTQQERRDLERRLLALQFAEERARNDYLIALYERLKIQDGITESELAEAKAAARAAELRNASIEERQANAQVGADRSTAGPLETFFDDIPSTADQINEALENVAAGGLATFTDALTDAIVNFRSLGDVGLAVLQNLTAALVRMAIQQIILKTIGKAIGQSATATTVAAAQAAAIAWAPAAALASLATLGANAGPAAAALSATTALSFGLAASGSAAGLKDGGPVMGPGGPIDDSVPLWGSNGEYMIKASSARKLGRATLDRMNLTGDLPYGYALGGPISGFVGPSNGAAARSGSGGMAMLDERSIGRLASIVGEAARAMPDVKLFPTLDPAAALQASLATPGGQRAFFDFITDNAGRFKAAVNS